MGNESAGRKRYWAKHKAQVVLRLLRGEDMELVSRELGLTAAEFSESGATCSSKAVNPG